MDLLDSFYDPYNSTYETTTKRFTIFSPLEVCILTITFGLLVLVSVCGNAVVCILLKFRYIQCPLFCLPQTSESNSRKLGVPLPAELWADENLSSQHECSCGKTFTPKQRTQSLKPYVVVTTFAHYGSVHGITSTINPALPVGRLYQQASVDRRRSKGHHFLYRKHPWNNRENSITSLFLFNLSLADCMMAILCIPIFVAAEIVYMYWPLGELMCKTVNYAQGISVFVSAFTHVLISWDRFVLVYFPLRPRMSYRYAVGLVCTIWFLACLLPLPVPIVNRIYTGGTKPQCVEDWSLIFPDSLITMNEQRQFICNITLLGREFSFEIGTAYTGILLFMQYFFPLGVICGTYAAIVIRIKKLKTPGEEDKARDSILMRARHKMAKLLITLAFIYGLSHLPRHIIYLHGSIHRELWTHPWSYRLWAAATFVRDMSTCYNPFIYAWANRTFRRDAIKLLSGIFKIGPHICCNSPSQPQTMLEMRIVNKQPSSATNNSSSAQHRAAPKLDYCHNHRILHLPSTGRAHFHS